MLSNDDLSFLAKKGISVEKLNEQLSRFKTGFPYLRLEASAKVGNGILRLSDADQDLAVARWDKYLADGGDVCKFVPASGAASRMFKALFSFVNGDEDTPKPGSDVDKLIANITKAPFYEEPQRDHKTPAPEVSARASLRRRDTKTLSVPSSCPRA